MPARRRKRAANTSQAPAVVRRRSDSPRGLRKLPPDLEDLAAGRRDLPRPRRRARGRIGDSRIAGLIPGVANHEARRVYDARLERCRVALADAAEDELGALLCDAVLLGLWRARSVTGLEALAQDVIGLDAERALRLAEAGAASRGLVLERLPEVAVALWMRGEATLLERCPEARVAVEVVGERVALRLELPLAPAERLAEAVSAIGRGAAGLGRVLSAERPARPGRKPPHGSDGD